MVVLNACLCAPARRCGRALSTFFLVWLATNLGGYLLVAGAVTAGLTTLDGPGHSPGGAALYAVGFLVSTPAVPAVGVGLPLVVLWYVRPDRVRDFRLLAACVLVAPALLVSPLVGWWPIAVQALYSLLVLRPSPEA
jgi:hypothetical protein